MTPHQANQLYTNSTIKSKAMTADDVRDFCLQKQNTTESFPFDTPSLIFKLMDKIFRALSTTRMGGWSALNHSKV